MSAPKDGGPAFACAAASDGMLKHQGGMTLRDYFAAKAFAAVFSIENTHRAVAEGLLSNETIASNCYEFADAMLKAREEVK